MIFYAKWLVWLGKLALSLLFVLRRIKYHILTFSWLAWPTFWFFAFEGLTQWFIFLFSFRTVGRYAFSIIWFKIENRYIYSIYLRQLDLTICTFSQYNSRLKSIFLCQVKFTEKKVIIHKIWSWMFKRIA